VGLFSTVIYVVTHMAEDKILHSASKFSGSDDLDLGRQPTKNMWIACTHVFLHAGL
jgi:hypothetical protein